MSMQPYSSAHPVGAAGEGAPSAGTRPSLRSTVAALVTGAVVLGALGGIYGATRPTTYSATTVLNILPDESVNSQVTGSTPTDQDATAFIQTELVLINGWPLHQQVQQQLHLAATPQVNASQVGQTYVVNLTATAPTQQQALQVAGTTASIYANQRSAQIANEVAAATKSTTAQLNSLKAQLAQNNPVLAPPTASAEQNAQNTQISALQNEIERLLAIQTNLALSQGEIRSAVTTLQPATLVSAGRLSPAEKYGIAGAVLGALLGLTVLLLTRRVSKRVHGVGDLSAIGVPVLLPALPRARGNAVLALRGGSEVASCARLLAARLVETGVGPSLPLVVVGAGRGVGTSYVAAALAAQLAERGPVVLVLAADTVTGPTAARRLGLRSDGTAPLDLTALSGSLDSLTTSADALPGVRILTADRLGGGRRGALEHLLAGGLLETLGAGDAHVVVDSPALSESSAAAEFARRAGVVVLVAADGGTTSVELLSAAEALEAQRAPLAGTLLNSPRRAAGTSRGAKAGTSGEDAGVGLVSSRSQVLPVSAVRADPAPATGLHRASPGVPADAAGVVRGDGR